MFEYGQLVCMHAGNYLSDNILYTVYENLYHRDNFNIVCYSHNSDIICQNKDNPH